jgi:hypothetical protein
MATKLGREGLIKLSSTTIGELRNYALTHSSDVVEDSVLGDTYRTRLASMKTFSVSGDLYWDETDAGQLLITIGSSVKFNVSASFDGIIEGQISFEGNGVLSVLTA